MSPLKTLYLTYDGLTDPLGQSQILPYLIGLSRQGYAISIISFEKMDAFEKTGTEIQSICQSANLNWFPLRYHKSPIVISTLYDLLVLRRKCDTLLKQEKFWLVHCRSYITSLIGLRLKKRYELKFIFDMRGFWADERVEGGLWNLHNPVFRSIYQYFKRKEKKFLLNADHIISLTESAAREIRSWKIETPISVIPTCVDLSAFNHDRVNRGEQAKLKHQLGIDPDHIVLVYLGSWGTWYETHKMLTFFTVVRKRAPAKFLILSRDSIDVSKFEFAEDVVIKSVKREWVPTYLSLATAAIAFIKTSFSKKASSATKVGEYLAMGLPVITNSGWGDVEQLESEDVFIAKELSPEGLALAASWLFGSPKNTHINLKGHALDLSVGINQYQRVYESMKL